MMSMMNLFTTVTLSLVLILKFTSVSAFVLPPVPSAFHAESRQPTNAVIRNNRRIQVNRLRGQVRSVDDPPWPYIPEQGATATETPRDLDELTRKEINVVFPDSSVAIKEVMVPLLCDTDDPYEILNLDRSATQKEVKTAYKRKAIMYHPDARITYDSSKDFRRKANDDFARINSAYNFIREKLEVQTRISERRARRESGGARSRADETSYDSYYERRRYNDSYWHYSPSSGDGYDWIN